MQYYFQIHYPDSNVASFPNHILYNFFFPKNHMLHYLPYLFNHF